MNIISQRYSKLCFLLYKAHGIKIDKDGDLNDPPKLESVDDLDEDEVGKLKRVPPPAILNVHRWSIEEDITLLKAVALMGSMWAELRARLIPHRDRGHLRKRYQVLERRVKATAARVTKHEKILSSKLGNTSRARFLPYRPRHILLQKRSKFGRLRLGCSKIASIRSIKRTTTNLRTSGQLPCMQRRRRSLTGSLLR